MDAPAASPPATGAPAPHDATQRPGEAAARRAAEAAARLSYGRLVAILAAPTRDVAAAEDALAEAFAAALRVWPVTGVPDRPEAWLVTAARRTLGHGRRADAVRERARSAVALAYEEAAAREADGLPDRRLELLFVCAHPAIDPAARAPLMLQCVLGLDAARIAGAFLVSEAAMAKRLVRAKARIRDAGIAFERPDADDLAARVGDVLSTVYAAYSAAWEMADGASAVAPDLAAEALWLARLVAALMPGEPEALGLLSLLLYCEARRPARRDDAGRFVPLAEQDTRLWVREMVVEAEGLLAAAARCRRFGRFQCEAAIQSVHCHRATTGDTDWPAILRLYDLLLAREPSLGAMVARAAALSSSGDADGALAALRAVGPATVERYQPYWATLADVLARRGERRAAEEARARAARLARDDAVRAFLCARCGT